MAKSKLDDVFLDSKYGLIKTCFHAGKLPAKPEHVWCRKSFYKVDYKHLQRSNDEHLAEEHILAAINCPTLFDIVLPADSNVQSEPRQLRADLKPQCVEHWDRQSGRCGIRFNL